MKGADDRLYVIGHLDWPTRVRFALGVAVSLVALSSIGFSVLQPWDPYGAISLLLADSVWYTLVRTSAVLLAVAVLATVTIDGRLRQFGTFAACVGLTYPVIKTGGMDYLMVRLQAGKEFEDPASLWGWVAMEILGWSIPLIIVASGSAIAERWIGSHHKAREGAPKTADGDMVKKTDVLGRGVLGTVSTILIAVVLVTLLLADGSEKGQVIFAVAASFFIAALVADVWWCNREPAWQIAAVPLVGFCVYLYTWYHPERPAGFEAILHLAPNSLSAVLPVEYICAGTVSAIFGTWTAERMRFARSHG